MEIGLEVIHPFLRILPNGLTISGYNFWLLGDLCS